MQRLLAVAAATGAMGVACTKEGSSDTIKSDDLGKSKPTVDTNATVATPTATTATTQPTATVTGTSTAPSAGYMVVDMLPPPAKCAGAAATIVPTASWKTSSTGALAVEVRLRKSTRPDVIYSSKGAPTAYSGTIVATTLTGSEVVITILPDKGASYAGIYVPLECKAGDERLNVELDLSTAAPATPPTSGSPVKVSLYDGY